MLAKALVSAIAGCRYGKPNEKAFGKALSAAGAKLKAHRTMESFNNIDPRIKQHNGYLEKTDVDGQVVAYYNPVTNEIHLSTCGFYGCHGGVWTHGPSAHDW